MILLRSQISANPATLLSTLEKKWMSPFVNPIGREIDFPEAPVFIDVHLKHFAEVVVIKLRQVLEQRPLITGCRLE